MDTLTGEASRGVKICGKVATGRFRQKLNAAQLREKREKRGKKKDVRRN